ncbi:MAG: sulfatase [Limisphaerales bacterium]
MKGIRLILTAFLCVLCGRPVAAERPPNIIHIIADDVGWDDFACYGAEKIKTPNLDRLAERGMRFTSFFAPAPLCSATRAALLTGCYAERIGIPGALMPHSTIGLSAKETTTASLLKQRGYATALVGKWHLGHQPEFRPTRHGFDEFFGIPYPNDQGAERNTLAAHQKDPVRPPIPLYDGERVVEHALDFEQAPVRFLNRALRFIDEHRDQPFFLHFANIETHVPWHIPGIWQGRSAAGAYGDAVEFFDWTVGQIVSFVEANGLGSNTLIVVQSDNGMLTAGNKDYETVWGRFGTVDKTARHRLRGSKHTVWEGGVRVPCLAAWPGRIRAGTTSDAIAAGYDWHPTFAAIAGARLPVDRVIDGRDLAPLLFAQPDAKPPHDTFFYYHSFRLGAVREGRWKLMIAPTGRGFDGPNEPVGKSGPPQLFDLESDLAETTDMAAKRPDIVERLLKLADHARADLGDSARKLRGSGQRPPGEARQTK